MWMSGKKNRESPRINANRIFLAFGCSAPAYRLRRNRTLSGKMLGKNPRAGFSYHIFPSSFFESGCGDATSARSVPRWGYLDYEINKYVLDLGEILEIVEVFQDMIQTLLKTRS